MDLAAGESGDGNNDLKIDILKSNILEKTSSTTLFGSLESTSGIISLWLRFGLKLAPKASSHILNYCYGSSIPIFQAV